MTDKSKADWDLIPKDPNQVRLFVRAIMTVLQERQMKLEPTPLILNHNKTNYIIDSQNLISPRKDGNVNSSTQVGNDLKKYSHSSSTVNRSGNNNNPHSLQSHQDNQPSSSHRVQNQTQRSNSTPPSQQRLTQSNGNRFPLTSNQSFKENQNITSNTTRLNGIHTQPPPPSGALPSRSSNSGPPEPHPSRMHQIGQKNSANSVVNRAQHPSANSNHPIQQSSRASSHYHPQPHQANHAQIRGPNQSAPSHINSNQAQPSHQINVAPSRPTSQLTPIQLIPVPHPNLPTKNIHPPQPISPPSLPEPALKKVRSNEPNQPQKQSPGTQPAQLSTSPSVGPSLPTLPPPRLKRPSRTNPLPCSIPLYNNSTDIFNASFNTMTIANHFQVTETTSRAFYILRKELAQAPPIDMISSILDQTKVDLLLKRIFDEIINILQFRPDQLDELQEEGTYSYIRLGVYISRYNYFTNPAANSNPLIFDYTQLFGTFQNNISSFVESEQSIARVCTLDQFNRILSYALILSFVNFWFPGNMATVHYRYIHNVISQSDMNPTRFYEIFSKI